MASFSIIHWLLIAAVVVLAVAFRGRLPRMIRDLRSGISELVRMVQEPGHSRPSWTTIAVLFVMAVAVLVASALFNGTWAG